MIENLEGYAYVNWGGDSMTNNEKRMLRTVAAFNDATEDQVKEAIVREYLVNLLTDETSRISGMKLQSIVARPAIKAEVVPANCETPESPRKKPGRKPKAKTADEIADEVEQAETDAKMTREEFIEYMSRRQGR